MKSRNFLALAALLATLSIASPVGATESSAEKKENSLTTITYNISNSLSTQGNSSKNTITYSTSLPNSAAKNLLNENITVFISIGGFILSIVVFVAPYYREQEWKFREFTTKEFKEFEEAPETISVKKMLNSKSQLIDLFPTATQASNRFIYVDDQMLNDALITFDNEQQELEYNKKLKEAQKRYQEKAQKNDKYPRKEEKLLIYAAIRDNFDGFAESLQHFESMIKSEAITEEDLAPYLEPLFYTIEQASKRTHSSNILKYLGLIGNHEQLSEVQKSIKNLRNRYSEKSPQDESNRNEKLLQKSDELYHHIARVIGLSRFPLL
jgi:hypothetical protein